MRIGNRITISPSRTIIGKTYSLGYLIDLPRLRRKSKVDKWEPPYRIYLHVIVGHFIIGLLHHYDDGWTTDGAEAWYPRSGYRRHIGRTVSFHPKKVLLCRKPVRGVDRYRKFDGTKWGDYCGAFRWHRGRCPFHVPDSWEIL